MQKENICVQNWVGKKLKKENNCEQSWVGKKIGDEDKLPLKSLRSVQKNYYLKYKYLRLYHRMNFYSKHWN